MINYTEVAKKVGVRKERLYRALKGDMTQSMKQGILKELRSIRKDVNKLIKTIEEE